ncbi:MAG: hypothetical protein GF419_12540 [Ignavibacteriales bacterium]|nr:hypothetical protein [Ignavibacteriales bacterium]
MGKRRLSPEPPHAEVFARPTRYTYEFPERYPTLTLTEFEERHREAPNLLGTA